MMQANHRVVTMRCDHAFGGIGDQISRNQACASPFKPLRQVVADSGSAERKTEHSRLSTAVCHQAAQVIGVDIAKIPFQQRNAYSDLRLIKVGFGHPKAVKERSDASLPPTRQLTAVPVQFIHDLPLGESKDAKPTRIDFQTMLRRWRWTFSGPRSIHGKKRNPVFVRFIKTKKAEDGPPSPA